MRRLALLLCLVLLQAVSPFLHAHHMGSDAPTSGMHIHVDEPGEHSDGDDTHAVGMLSDHAHAASAQFVSIDAAIASTAPLNPPSDTLVCLLACIALILPAAGDPPSFPRSDSDRRQPLTQWLSSVTPRAPPQV